MSYTPAIHAIIIQTEIRKNAEKEAECTFWKLMHEGKYEEGFDVSTWEIEKRMVSELPQDERLLSRWYHSSQIFEKRYWGIRHLEVTPRRFTGAWPTY